MGEPVNPTVPLTADDAMQQAANYLFGGTDPVSGFPPAEGVRAAQVLVSMARELRLGANGRAKQRYNVVRNAEITDEVANFVWRKTPGAVGYTIRVAPPSLGGTTVTPIFSDEVSESGEEGDTLT